MLLPVCGCLVWQLLLLVYVLGCCLRAWSIFNAGLLCCGVMEAIRGSQVQRHGHEGGQFGYNAQP